MEGVNTITLEDLLLPEQKLESSLNLLPEEILCIIFSYVSCYTYVTGSVCRKWQRLCSEFRSKPFLLLAYVYKDDLDWFKKEYSLPENIKDLYIRERFSYSSMENIIDSIIEEGSPDTLTWMLENRDMHLIEGNSPIYSTRRILFNKAMEKKNYKVLNWMKEQGMIDSDEYFDDLMRTISVVSTYSVYICAMLYMSHGDKQMLSWYLSSKLPCDECILRVIFKNKEKERKFLT
ncbi:F-box domain-containing protein [Cedratvirus Zaza IHUMI]|uniref:F-box domain-containing protein n=1 Tax=Cedratvirus Zaza IHUMI TaxID=2126979 RepID=A0A2R8FFN3_9VIRU|nr:F-box domain-containing protein [Cedratvirus Zaza IHUMI]